jgi:nuclear receptor coactivator 2
MGFPPNQTAPSHPDLQAKRRIIEIQKSLMQIENTVTSPLQQYDTSPPAYPLHELQQSPNAPATSNSNFQPPPVYQQRQVQVRMPQQPNNAAMMRQIQFQQRTRLLQQQKQQQMVVPENATADQLC